MYSTLRPQVCKYAKGMMTSNEESGEALKGNKILGGGAGDVGKNGLFSFASVALKVN
jgi:hypothetical protein